MWSTPINFYVEIKGILQVGVHNISVSLINYESQLFAVQCWVKLLKVQVGTMVHGPEAQRILLLAETELATLAITSTRSISMRVIFKL